MNTKSYKVVCLKCDGSSRVDIDDMDRVFWIDTNEVISARKRLDSQWGFECLCGNNDIVTRQEAREIKNLQSPAAEDIEAIIQSIKPDKPRFTMVGA